MAHHNTYEASQYIHQEYRSHLHDLDNQQYYADINRVCYSQDSLAAQDYWPANQSAEPHRTMEELKRNIWRRQSQARREELHGHRPLQGPSARI